MGVQMPRTHIIYQVHLMVSLQSCNSSLERQGQRVPRANGLVSCHSSKGWVGLRVPALKNATEG